MNLPSQLLAAVLVCLPTATALEVNRAPLKPYTLLQIELPYGVMPHWDLSQPNLWDDGRQPDRVDGRKRLGGVVGCSLWQAPGCVAECAAANQGGSATQAQSPSSSTATPFTITCRAPLPGAVVAIAAKASDRGSTASGGYERTTTEK